MRRFSHLGFLLLSLALSACGKGQTGNAEETLLFQSVKQIGAESSEGTRSALLCELGDKHLDYMIGRGSLSHDDFDKRQETVRSQGGSGAGEIVAYNCGQASAAAAATKCAQSWEESSGHRTLMRRRWDAVCYQMKATADGCVYCIGLFANGL